jgi:hypothetical protein
VKSQDNPSKTVEASGIPCEGGGNFQNRTGFRTTGLSGQKGSSKPDTIQPLNGCQAVHSSCGPKGLTTQSNESHHTSIVKDYSPCLAIVNREQRLFERR